MFNGPFVTDLDPQADVKGSRDPLGIQTIWGRLGRQVVGNLTTVSNSVRDFSTLILGYYFAARVANEGVGDGDLAVFLQWEQLAAYARGEINGDWEFRGVVRAKANLRNGSRIRLGLDTAAQILSNQKTYGLWGLYTVPARSSGLVEGDPTRITPAARELIENVYLPLLSREGLRNADAIVLRLAKSFSVLDINTDRRFLTAIAKVLAKQISVAERDIFRRHLLLGGPSDRDRTGGKQAVLAAALETTLDEPNWSLSQARVRDLEKRCARQGDTGRAVAERLGRIRAAESLLAPAAVLFLYMLASDGQKIAELSDVVGRQWGNLSRTIDVEAVALLEAELRESPDDPSSGQRWVQVSKSLAMGSFEQAIRLLIDQNAFVMQSRTGGAPWIDLVDGKIRVRFRDEGGGELTKRVELSKLWRHPYFLDSLRTVALALRA